MAKLLDKKLQERIGFEPHIGQQEVLEQVYQGKRDIVISAGRRWGKSMLCAYLSLRQLLLTDKRTWIVAPTYDLTQKVFDHLIGFISRGQFKALAAGITSRPTPRINNLSRQSWIQCKSTENPEGLLGEELNLAIVDEVSKVKKNVYESYLYPCLTSRRGKTVMISTPFGQNWFYEQWLRAKESKDGAAFQFPSNSNPHFDPKEWDRAREKLPEKIFKQEFCASFEPEAAGVFRNVRKCIAGELQDSVPGRHYVMGIDLGKIHDYTVICVIDKQRRHLVYYERFKKIDWKFQRARIRSVWEMYNHAGIWIDSTGKGDPVVDELLAEGIFVNPYRIKSNRTKRQLVEKLSTFLDRAKITYPAIEEVVDELEAFTYNLTPSGVIQYQAPSGLHDDIVIALALACWGLTGREKDLTPLQEEMQKIQRSQSRKFEYR